MVRCALIMALFLCCFLNCSDEDEHVLHEGELEILTNMVKQVSFELSDLGFAVDPERVGIEVKDAAHMASLFNQLNDKSRPQIEDFLGTPSLGPSGKKPLFRDGAMARLAFYDPNTQTIVFQEGAAFELSMGDLAHELTHAFQDQKWGFDALWQPYQEHPSRELYNIIHYALEGYAELVSKSYEQAHSKTKKASTQLEWTLAKLYDNECVVCGASGQTAQMPYLVGTRFFLHQFKEGSWNQVDQSLSSLPSSTEQMLHPAKLGKDEPTTVTLPLWQPDKVKVERVADGCMGEAFLLAKLLSISMPSHEAYLAASGWDGDVAHVYRSKDGTQALLWRIVFDRYEDATQLERGVSSLGMSKNVMKMGRVVDWIITENEDLLRTSRIFMSKNPMSLEKPLLEDKRLTQEEEQQFKAGGAVDSFYPTEKIRLSPRRLYVSE